MAAVPVQLRNDITGFRADAVTAADGTFQFFNVPFNPYELHVEAQGFQPVHRAVDVRSSTPQRGRRLAEAGRRRRTVTVTAEQTAAQLETDTSMSHVDIDKSYIARAPATVASRAMEELITATPGFAKDENGRYHFQGFHSQGAVRDRRPDHLGPDRRHLLQLHRPRHRAVDGGHLRQRARRVRREDRHGHQPDHEVRPRRSVPRRALRRRGALLDLRGRAARGRGLEDTSEPSAPSTAPGPTASSTRSTPTTSTTPATPSAASCASTTPPTTSKDQVRLTALAGPHATATCPTPTRRRPPARTRRSRAGTRTTTSAGRTSSPPKAALDVNASARLSRFELFPSANDTPVLADSDRTLDNYSLTPSFTYGVGPPRGEGRRRRQALPDRRGLQLRHHRPGLQRPRVRRLQPQPRSLRPDAGAGSRFVFHGKRTGTYLRVLRPGQLPLQGPDRQPGPALRPQQPAHDRGPVPAPDRARLLLQRHRHRAAGRLQPALPDPRVREHPVRVLGAGRQRGSARGPGVAGAGRRRAAQQLGAPERVPGGRRNRRSVRSCVSTSISGGAGPRTPPTRTSS